MKSDSTPKSLFDELKQIIETVEPESILEALKDKALNVEIKKREQFENVLLKLAQEIPDKGIRPILYEAMVSLQSNWGKNQPKQMLQNKFWAAIEEEAYEEAALIYRELAKQGLDYIDTFHLGEGQLIALVTTEEQMILRYSEDELIFYDFKLEQSSNIKMPGTHKIIDVIAPYPFRLSPDSTKEKEPDKKIWILLKNKEGKKDVFYLDPGGIYSTTIDSNLIEQRAFPFYEEENVTIQLSYCKGQLLLASKNAVYYRKNDTWKKWYAAIDSEITAFDFVEAGFWVGHANGDVRILKDLEYVGVRDAFKQYDKAIRRIHRSGNFLLISCYNCLCITDHAGSVVLGPVETHSDIVHSVVLNNEFVLTHMANGMLMARELRQGNIRWQINLGDIFETIFTSNGFVCCNKKNGDTRIFENPLFPRMAKVLASMNIFVDIHSIEAGPDAPVRYISEFIGRKKILDEIKSKSTAHFLFQGEPRVGKTSLLNVLCDTLSESGKCCFIDIAQLLKDSNSYPEFEKHFIDKCLGQHFLNLSDLAEKNGYQAFREMVARIRGSRLFCIFCLDNFLAPEHFDKESLSDYKTFLRSMLVLHEVRVIMTCNSSDMSTIDNFFDGFNDILSKRRLFHRRIFLFSEMEVKNALRKNVSPDQDTVDEMYKYIGRFPHLVHLYDNLDVKRHSIEVQSRKIAKEFSNKVFEYFRDLSPDAYLLIATCIKNNILSEKTGYATFHDNFPFLKSSLPRPDLEQALKDINGYGDGFFADSDKESFTISLKEDATLFHKASSYISWLNDFSILFDFTSSPDQKGAHEVAQTFTKITESTLELDAYPGEFMKKYKKVFYVKKLTDEGRRALDMPLATFIVIPLKPWQKSLHKHAFNDLHVSIQELERLSGKFYILLLELHGTPAETIKGNLIGLERISIIDAPKMKNIILDKTPGQKASEYIFDQLSIKERSPYTTAGAVPDELFFGREMEIQLIRGLPENIGIFGIRTIGKTSLLGRLNKDIKSQKRWNVYSMDCARIDSEELLLKNLAEKMSIPFESISDMEEFRRYVTKEAESSGKQFLFLLDEVDRLVQYDTGHEEEIFNTFNRLTTEAMENGKYAARFILFGFQTMFEQMKNPNSRLYNFMVFLPLKPLDVVSALALVTNPIEKIRVRWKDKNDASYLVDNCSCHPRLMQSACHSLLTILDSKKDNKDVIERIDVDRALTSADFREMCMRFYQNPEDEKEKKEPRKKTLFHPFSKTTSSNRNGTQSEKPGKGNHFWNDLHRITILSAIRLGFEGNKERFTIRDIQGELKRRGLNISPNAMRIILDHLCLSGNFRLLTEATLIAHEDADVQKKVEQNKGIKSDKKNLTVGKPDDKKFPKFIYEFGVKIFPQLLVAHFGGIDQCKDELKELVAKKDWEAWLRRY